MARSAAQDFADRLLADTHQAYQPAMQRLRDEISSTELVDKAKRFDVGQASKVRSRVSTAGGAGGLTSRQKAIQDYLGESEAVATGIGLEQLAKQQQSDQSETARSKLENFSVQLANLETQNRLEAFRLDQDYELTQKRLKAQQEAAKNNFNSAVGGLAAGAAAALLI